MIRQTAFTRVRTHKPETAEHRHSGLWFKPQRMTALSPYYPSSVSQRMSGFGNERSCYEAVKFVLASARLTWRLVGIQIPQTNRPDVRTGALQLPRQGPSALPVDPH